jgi:hypothetical protein
MSFWIVVLDRRFDPSRVVLTRRFNSSRVGLLVVLACRPGLRARPCRRLVLVFISCPRHRYAAVA